MKKLRFMVTGLALLFAVLCNAQSVKDIIARNHTVTGEDQWHGFHRIKFDFEGYTAWVVEPSVKPVSGNPWTWTMQWADAYVPRTGVTDLLSRGCYHVTLEAFSTRATDDVLPVFAAFQAYLVDKLGFASKTNLIGMSWGGFFSIRYAAAYPQNVRRIYLDAPLLNFDGFKGDNGPWEELKTGSCWTDDPRMPVNMAGRIASAGIPVLLIYGGQDQSVNPVLNCELFASRLKASGGSINIRYRSAYGHHPHGMDPGDTGLITDFFGL